MRPLKPIFSLIGTVVPIIYCGYLLHYFLDQAGSLEEAKAIGLGPTLLGLAVVGLFFFIVFAIKLVLIFIALRSRRPGGRGGPDAPTDGDGFDADAVVARYMARRSAEVPPNTPAPPPAHGGSANRASFGRKVR